MLSVQRCRELLGPSAPSSDEEIEVLRNQLYAVATVWLERGAPRLEPSADSVLGALPEDERADVEERAALMEFDGGASRDVAERMALTEFLGTSNGRTH